MSFEFLLGPEGDVGGRLPWPSWGPADVNVSENQCLIASVAFIITFCHSKTSEKMLRKEHSF